MALNTLVLILGLFIPQGNGDDKKNDSMEMRLEKGQSLMETVFDRFHINYEMSRLHKVGYYKESVSDSASTYYLAEGIVDIYIPCNLSKSENASISPIKARKTVFKQVDQESLLLGNASDMARSSIWRPNSFLDEKNRYDYNFSLSAEDSFKGSEVAVIEFEPRKEHGTTMGRIYVDKKSFAIVKIEYQPIVIKSKVWQNITWTEEFTFRNGAYELTNVHFHGEGADNHYQYDATLIMNQLEVVSKFPENEEFIQDEVPLFERAKEELDESFWEGFSFLRQSLNAEQFLTAQNH
ncbi:hypothetical protein [Ekhidna sp.]|uniref:hypothetical protein n=1 Tax=Ekhidna sp. TaxID=2608089 RepID=UPI003CCBEC9B